MDHYLTLAPLPTNGREIVEVHSMGSSSGSEQLPRDLVSKQPRTPSYETTTLTR